MAVLANESPAWDGELTRTASAAAVDDVAGRLPHTSLEEVLAAAELQTRVDHKYLVPVDVFARLGERLAGSFHVLEIGDRRAFGYESVYFDTPDLALYRQHVQGRRRRFKVRTRTYVDSGDSMFEVKLKGLRGQTVKSRMPHPSEHRSRITGPAREFLDALLRSEYGNPAPALEPSVTTTYTRTTLVDLAAGTRVTCDVDLVCASATASRSTPSGHVLVETKTAPGSGSVDDVLRDLGMRPVSVSKYCVGVALLHSHLPANPWHRLLHRHFGYSAPASTGC